MRQTILAAAAAFVIGGVATGAGAVTGPACATGGRWRGGPKNGAAGPVDGMETSLHAGQGLRTFALIYRQQDRQLAAADVQKIAEAFLLWNGNHAWKVTDVAATADGPIGFSLATPEGSVVAKFTMDPHSARITRVD